MTAVALRAILMMPLAVPIREAYSGEDVGDLFKAGPCPERNDIAPGITWCAPATSLPWWRIWSGLPPGETVARRKRPREPAPLWEGRRSWREF